MGQKWQKTKHPGIRFREHPTRKNGVRFDRYYVVRYRVDGKAKQEAIGWASQGWTEQKALARLSELKEAHRTGEGARTLAEKREIAEERRRAEREAKEQAKLDSLTFSEFWSQTYYPQVKRDKSKGSWEREDVSFRLWIKPVIGKLPLKQISPIHLERIKSGMVKAGKAPRTIQYALAVIRQTFNRARNIGVLVGDNPVSKIKQPKVDNRRIRFLTHEEADLLFKALEGRGRDLYEMALLSLQCGLRQGEIFKLTRQDVDLDRGLLTLRDTKSGRTRHAYLTAEVTRMLSERLKTIQTDEPLLFPARGGGEKGKLSRVFRAVIDELGLNIGISDPRQKVVFHTLRHTYASWLVQQGTPLYTVQKLMGHQTMAMTERYAHLAPDHLRMAVQQFDLNLQKTELKKMTSEKTS